MIGASPDPRALRRYARAGFELYPAYSAEGVPDLTEAPAGLGVREGDWERDRELFETLVAQRRGEPYGPDLDFLRRPDARLFVRDGPTPSDRAVCLLRHGRSAMVAAASDGGCAPGALGGHRRGAGRRRAARTSPEISNGPSTLRSPRGSA